jgi:hypothetical protein
MTNIDINQLFLRCSSHTMCGIKPANLFTIPSQQFSKSAFENWEVLANRQGISISAFKSSSNITMIFIYNIVWIGKILEDSFVQAYLCSKGFSNLFDTTKTLRELFYRLQTNKNFPHEVGIFLGYPIEDVIGFEKNQGKSSKYCGYWKSYCNPEEAKRCCERYKQCSQMCNQWFSEGYSIPQIIKKYKEMAKKAA